MSFAAAAGGFLVVLGLISLGFGLGALLRGGRGQRGGIGPLSERGVHVVAGLRMTLVGVLCLAAGAYVLYSHYAG
ncbi:hypothetical protein [Rubrobacter calidifluminis]|uniref:hypothetical protein n=1 Tax=Rubrobacter calidifluminis TaxID=1392640 RepID=UPI002362254B|nr:hypothetical protein [Rubrobacter calidifluminis]